MSRAASPRRKRSSTAVALFPFLAVLICTMGSLIVVLVVLARQAQTQAAQATSEKASELKQEIQNQGDMAQWRIEQLQEAAGKAREEMSDARLELGHLEETSQQLRRQFESLQAAWQELENLKRPTAGDRKAAAAELDRRREQIAVAQRALTAAQRAASERPKSYAVVPYNGRNGTHRRPIFIECRADRIVLQPEGIELRESDFELLFEPGNPLDRGLRAAREAMRAEKQIGGDGSDEPYPLLLVRPEGIAAYYIARAAMLSHKSEVGYELIGDDWKLDFPPPSLAVSRAVREAVEQSRRELDQKRLLAAAIGPKRSGATYRALPGGGLSREVGGDGDGGGGDDDSDNAPRFSTKPSNAVSEAVGSPSGGKHPAGGRYAAGPTGAASNGGTPPHGAPGGSGGNDSDDGPPSTAPGDRLALVGPRRSGAAAGGKSGRSTDPNTSHADAGPSQASGAQRLGEWEESTRRRYVEREDTKKEDGKKTSLSESRGKNWGLPDATRGSHPVSRPVRLACREDRIEFLMDTGYYVTKTVPLQGATEQSVDAFVSAVWEHLKLWGIAGRGLYWRPHFVVEVAPGGEHRFEELQWLLKGSGLELKREGKP